MSFPLTRSVIEQAIAARAFPAAVIEVGRAHGPLWQQAFGALRYEPDATPAALDTVFDLASLTKVMATTSFVMRLVQAGRLDIDQGVADIYPVSRPDRYAGVRLRHLLDHSAGLPAHVRFWERARDRTAVEREVFEIPLETPPGHRSVYSDVGFIQLGLILERVAGLSLARQMDELAEQLELGEVRYVPPETWRDRTAPTEFDPWRDRLLVGEVHDENAAVLGGTAGHAGLFGTAPAVGRFARAVLTSLRGALVDGRNVPLPLMPTFATRTGVVASSRALGWDTMLPTSSCGSRLSAESIGHTGFTGTSLWIDPTRDVYVVLLTNRVYPTRANDAIRSIRPKVHDAVVEDIDRVAEEDTGVGV